MLLRLRGTGFVPAIAYATARPCSAPAPCGRSESCAGGSVSCCWRLCRTTSWHMLGKLGSSHCFANCKLSYHLLAVPVCLVCCCGRDQLSTWYPQSRASCYPHNRHNVHHTTHLPPLSASTPLCGCCLYTKHMLMLFKTNQLINPATHLCRPLMSAGSITVQLMPIFGSTVWMNCRVRL